MIVGWGPALRKFLWIGLASFGGGRVAYLHDAFARSKWIPEDVFLRDYAIAQILPGATFPNLALLNGIRLGGLPLGLAGMTLLYIPGIIAITIAMAVVSTNDPTVTRVLHGILVGAAGVLLATVIRLFRSNIHGPLDAVVAAVALAMMVAGVPLAATLLLTVGFGVWRARLRQVATRS